MPSRGLRSHTLRLLLAALLLLLTGGGGWYVWQHPALLASLSAWLAVAGGGGESAGSRISGYIEAPQTITASEVSGRIVRLHVAVGDQVTAGQPLLELDATLLDAQLAEADAAVKLAEAQQARLAAGVRAEEEAVARQAVTLAEAQRDAALQAWQDARTLQANPQELDLQIAAARSAVTVTARRVEQATAVKDAAELLAGARARQVATLGDAPWISEAMLRQLHAGWNLATTDVWSAWANLNRASAGQAAAQRALADLLAQRENPQALELQAVQAEAAVHKAEAAVTVAQASLAQMRAGASDAQRRTAQRAVEQANAARAALRVLRQRYTLRAPRTGQVLQLSVHAGEVAMPGAPLLAIGNLDAVELVVYAPTSTIGALRLGAEATVWVDAWPAAPRQGVIVWIAEQAEFTPKNVQTQNERAQTVFAVRLRIANPQHDLKPGMGAEVSFAAAGPGAPAAARSSASETAALQGSGVIEADALALVSETGGRLIAVHAAEGMTTTAGATLAELDASLLAAHISQAEAAAATAQARFDQVNEPPRAEAIAVAQAEFAQAQALREGAYAVWLEAQAAITQPLALTARVGAAEGQVRILTQQVDAAQAAVKAAEIQRDEAERSAATDEERTQGLAAAKQLAAAQANHAAAQAELAGAQRQLTLLKALRANPLVLQAQAHQAEGAWRQAEAGQELAKARLQLAQSGPFEPDVTIAAAQLEQAQAAVATAQAHMARLKVIAPQDGIILEQAAHAGEVVAPGAVILRLADLRVVRLRIYLPVGQLRFVQLGQRLPVAVDAFADETFTGVVTEIGATAEFTPKTVQTADERNNLVVAVLLMLDNPDWRLKPGMWADLTGAAP